MKKLNPTSVKIHWSGKNATRDAFHRCTTPDEETFKSLYDDAIQNSTDGINSKELVDNLVKEEDNIVIGGTVIGEIERLFVKCFTKATMISFTTDTPTYKTMRSLDKCISSILNKRGDTSDSTIYLTRYNINYLLDINNIDKTSSMALRLVGFVEYLIKTFTNSKQAIS